MQINDYVESINQYTAGGFDGCVMTNMDALTISAVGGIDNTALIVGDFSNGNHGIVSKTAKSVAELSGKSINLVELSVSHYLLARALEQAGLAERDLGGVVNTSDADIVSVFTSTSDVEHVRQAQGDYRPAGRFTMHDDHHAPGPGHNASRPVQWQTPHRPDGGATDPPETEPDLDLVEAAFAEAFAAASDPTSFLRLAGIPFTGTGADGRRLGLLRVELDHLADVGALTPRLGGGEFRYDPLPAKLVSRRRRLRFVYHDGEALVTLSFAQARALAAT